MVNCKYQFCFNDENTEIFKFTNQISVVNFFTVQKANYMINSRFKTLNVATWPFIIKKGHQC